MSDLFANPGMTAVFVIVVALEIFSFLVMGVVLLAFRSVHRKQRALFSTLCDVPSTFPYYIVIIWTYVIMTIVIAIVSFGLFVFQPHFL
ncbi:MAG: hypothetical protein Greene041662_321 [Candidatus Peregrinibacteria bacterium Greene0416_62]|nr:MAG: hypothetical protein Greene041662_321 [Candidatus Peregrinibacteria bacterium Greene0416_62]TSC98777.1 MAG: hypothetical protein Greene101449_846 [Candidatus Peregrinibacteria bacterium Greene1014_49]